MERARLLQSVYGVQLEVIWEHDWILMKDSHPSLKRFLQSFNAPEPLSPREALYGGRTCALRLRYTAGEEESVHYVDFTSLYPYVNATCPYPLGHPKIICKDFDDPRNYFGFIRATVFPPRGLFFPVLPYKTSTGKLVFTLCRACAEMNYQAGPCSHTDRERALTGVWVTLEFNKALELGYTVAEITEVWHFEKQSSSIFKPYIHTFLKGKQEASGFPAEATDEESRLKYVADYKREQGIQLDVRKIEANPAKRQVAKLCLNSFWGKFAQRNDLAQTTIVTDSAEFFNFLFSGKYVVCYFHFLNDDMCMIQWKYNKRCMSLPNKVNNVFIAAFTTAHARLKLFTCLEPLQERVLYIDTDSLIYVVKPGQTSLELGNYLGDLTDELGGDTIQQFVSTGPKSYAYQTRNQKKVVMRCKGITQTQECSERVNFDSVKELVEGYLQGSTGGVLEAPQHTIRRDKRNFQLKNATFQKKFRLVYDKRRLFPDGTTLPFGY
ncbi:DNA polymerase-like [Fundulus heteroclitus]|uniref:DNA polymerase-like n=1 Tax=Fundulus heteroclitus TaxID=8078 RepID=UPI00165A9C98|nr:DNA polymerase-like [Fundulus heteroclitus]